VHRLNGTAVDITLIDRRKPSPVSPLLYQVATASLATSEIACRSANCCASVPKSPR